MVSDLAPSLCAHRDHLESVIWPYRRQWWVARICTEVVGKAACAGENTFNAHRNVAFLLLAHIVLRNLHHLDAPFPVRVRTVYGNHPATRPPPVQVHVALRNQPILSGEWFRTPLGGRFHTGFIPLFYIPVSDLCFMTGFIGITEKV